MMHITEGGNRWISGLEDLIWAICDEHTWVLPAHVGLNDNKYPDIWDRPLPHVESVDLFAGDTAFAFSRNMHWSLFAAKQTDSFRKEESAQQMDYYFKGHK